MKKTKLSFLSLALVLALVLMGCPEDIEQQTPDDDGSYEERPDLLPAKPKLPDPNDYFGEKQIPAGTYNGKVIVGFTMSKVEIGYAYGWYQVRSWAEKPGANYTFTNPPELGDGTGGTGVMGEHETNIGYGSFSGDAGDEKWGGNWKGVTISSTDNKPVCQVSLRDVLVWCNAYSEATGKSPVYRNKDGKILKDATKEVEKFISVDQMTGRNGYRLPDFDEWMYACLAGGTELSKAGIPGNGSTYGMYGKGGSTSGDGNMRTTTVGKSEYTNTYGMADMVGNAWEWVFTEGTGENAGKYALMGGDFNSPANYNLEPLWEPPTQKGGRTKAVSFRVMINNK